MNAPPVVFDSGVLHDATANKAFRATVRDLVAKGRKPLIPTVVLAEAISGSPRDAATNQTISRYTLVETPESVARQAGALRYRAMRSRMRQPPSAVDAIVAAHAVDADASSVFTTDPDDLQRLLADHPRIHIRRP